MLINDTPIKEKLQIYFGIHLLLPGSTIPFVPSIGEFGDSHNSGGSC